MHYIKCCPTRGWSRLVLRAPLRYALGPTAQPPRYAAQKTTIAAPLSASFWLRFKRLWSPAGLRQYPRRLSRPQTSTLKLPSSRHRKVNLNRKGRRANAFVKPISSGSSNTSRQIEALAPCCCASSDRRPAKPESSPAFYRLAQKAARHVWRSRPTGLHFWS